MAPEFDAVILAAGFSSRMAGFKPLYRLGETTALERVIGLFQEAGVRETIVVAGHNGPAVESAAKAAGARPVRNPRYPEGMFSSIQAGVAALRPGFEAFFLLPVDIPLVRPISVKRLWRAFLEQGALVAHPCFLGQRGHPPLLSRALEPAIANWNGDGGLRNLLDELEARNASKARSDFPVIDVPVADQGVLLDMDTEADHEELSGRRPDLPSREECDALLDIAGAQARTVNHGRAVARVAVAMAMAVNGRQKPGKAQDTALDIERVERAALVHDIAKGMRSHEAAGAAMLNEYGFTAISDIVGAHRDIPFVPGMPLGEAEIVFLADKLVAGEELVPVTERYGRVLERHGGDPEARAAIEGRLNNALAMLKLVEEAVGEPLSALAAKALK